MNVLLHIASGIGIAVLLTDTRRIQSDTGFAETLKIGINAFAVGVITHGALDYIPHCYPINSKIDVILGLGFIIGFILLTNRKYKLITGLAFLGCIFPDLFDLSPSILNKYLGFNLPVLDKVFPWHWHDYSGSIYNDKCNVSTINHILILVVIVMICWARRIDFKVIFNKKINSI